MDVIAAIHGRRSVRAYQNRAVERDILESIIWDAAQAPPPFAGQVPWQFHVFAGAKRLADFGKRAKDYARTLHPGEPGWEWTQREEFLVFWGAPVVIVVAGRVEDCCRAGQNLMLSAFARGLGTCWVGSPMLWLRDPVVKAELGMTLEPVAAFCLGYPGEMPAPKPREHPVVVWD